MTINGRGDFYCEYSAINDEKILIRVDDNDKPSFWLEIELTRANIEDMIKRMDKLKK